MKTWNQGLLRNEAEGSPEGGGVATLAPEGSADSAPAGSLTSEGISAGEGSWRDNLAVSDEVKQWGGFDNIKDPSDAITQLYNAQKVMGAEKIAKPQETWTEEQWTSHYRDLGVPESTEGYSLPDLPEALAEHVTPESRESYKEMFKAANLTPSQASKLTELYEASQAEAMLAHQEKQVAATEQGLRNLQVEWGDQFNTKFDIAKAAVKKIGGDALIKALNETGTSQHPEFIKAFAEIGNTVLEASSAKGGSSGMIVSNRAQASQILKERNRDPEWTKALMDKDHPAHDDVVKERMELYTMAHGDD
jgi:hypothetical protein